MTKDEEIIDSLIAGGLIGAALGVLIAKDKGAGVTLGAIAGAAILASVKASEKAKQTNVSLVVEEDGVLYRVKSDGTKKTIKKISKVDKKIPKRFTLKS